MELVEGAMDGEEAPLQEVPLAHLTMTKAAEVVASARRLQDCPEPEGAALN